MTRLFRIEHDSLGPVEVSDEALWGAQTERSLRNFAISNERIPVELIHALAMIKQGCAAVNARHGVLNQELADKIISAANAIATGEHDDQFPLKVWQTGSGTQTNMNVNEVLSNRAIQLLGGVGPATKLLSAYTRRGPNTEALKDALFKPLSLVLARKKLDLEIDPARV